MKINKSISVLCLVLAFVAGAKADGNLISTCTISLSKVPDGAVNGKAVFTVDASTGQKVFFSKGNLQYKASKAGVAGDLQHNVQGGLKANGSWRFAVNQYDVIGVEQGGNVAPASTNTNWQDIFCWATSGSTYAPYYRNDNSYPTMVSSIAESNDDWGYFNVIEQAGATPGQWRTLTKNEWCCLLGINTSSVTARANAASKRSFATVNGVAGLMLLPDEWSWSETGLSAWTVTTSSYTTNVYDTDDWKALEEQGAVFLPIGGYRHWDATSVDAGYYWGAETYSTSNSQNPFCIFFNASDLSYENYSSKTTNNGMEVRTVSSMSVRLVQNAINF